MPALLSFLFVPLKIFLPGVKRHLKKGSENPQSTSRSQPGCFPLLPSWKQGLVQNKAVLCCHLSP